MTDVLVTGASGFIGRNLCLRLDERGHKVIAVGREEPDAVLVEAAARANFVIHLAGVNRSQEEGAFVIGNTDCTRRLCEALVQAGNSAPIIYASSTQASLDNPYGCSKRAAEQLLLRHSEETGGPLHIFRLPNVFGKWARPDYNSAIATFCYRTARGQQIDIHNPAAAIKLVYIDDVIDSFLNLIEGGTSGFHEIDPSYSVTVQEVADIIQSFPASRQTMLTPSVGAGLIRALYSTYLSYLQPIDFSYHVPIHSDPRGTFVEMLKTQNSGQFSYFTARPGETRGNHYHHTKAEKFLVIAGTAHFGFRHITSGETFEIVAEGGQGRIIETVPGWTHNVSNIGDEQLVIMLWANEIFDRLRPDTIAMKV